MPRNQTIDILNDAYDMQRRLDWVLFSNENEHHGSESEWVPGDPLYDYPNYIYDGQYVRPMFELMDSFHNPNRVVFFARCRDCMVYLEGSDPCWVCGEERPSFLESYDFGDPVPYEYVNYTRNDATVTRSLYSRPQLRIDVDFAEFVDSTRVIQQLVVEMRNQLENSVGRAFENFRNVILSMPSHYGRSGFRPWGVVIDEWANAYDPHTVLVNGIRIPRVIPTEPVIELPGFHFSSTYFDRPPVEIPQKSYPTSINPTRQRRPRRS